MRERSRNVAKHISIVRVQHLLIALMLVASCGFGQTTATQKPSSTSPAISISVVPPSDPVHLGSPILLKVTVKNISGRLIGWESAHQDTAYQAFNVSLEQKNRKVETTRFHRKMKNEQRPDDPPEVKNTDTTLFQFEPGESLTFTIDVTKLYQITEPGTYTLDVSRFDDTSKTTVHAKPVTLEIVP